MMNSKLLFGQTEQPKLYDCLFYQRRLHEYVETFSYASLTTHRKDPLSAFLMTIMENLSIRRMITDCREGARIFVDTMMDFVTLYLKKANYYRQRRKAEENEIQKAESWSEAKIISQRYALLEELELKYSKQGFVGNFYAQEFAKQKEYVEEGLWQSLLQEWQKQINLKIDLQKREFIQERGKDQIQLLLNNLKGASQYIIEKSINQKEFEQTWALMGGRWNTLIFERLYRTTLLQRRYPILGKIADSMGRKSDKNGAQRIATISGRSEKISHTSKSDITGISLGNNLNALLPSELALFMDRTTEDVFFHKYVAHHLQIFDYQSKMANAARNLQTQAARQRGPIIVCVDTSGSMAGDPSKIALSLMMKLAEMSEQDNRQCFLIAFSVHAEAIDVLLDRTQLLKFFTRQASGDTDARRMLSTLFQLLQLNSRYVGADVLWITDFRIPLPPVTDLQQIEQLQKSGTHFFGLQIGIAENRWQKYFDKIFSISDTP